jgi:hypothetical protein
MTIGMWFQDDLANLLASVAQTQMSIMGYIPKTPEANAYQAGCVDTLAALSMALGLPSNNGMKLTRGTSRDDPGRRRTEPQ